MNRIDDNLLIGIDVGNANVKTANHVFSSGVIPLGDNKGYAVKDHTLVYGNKIFKVGESRSPIQFDRTSNDTMFVLTLAAIAMEMRKEQIYDADIVLGVGVPFGDLLSLKKSYSDYYKSKRRCKFLFEGDQFSIRIKKVKVYPQAYSGIVPRIKEFADCTIIDIGGRTTDILPVRNMIPVEGEGLSMDDGMISFIHELQKQIRMVIHYDIKEIFIMDYLIGKFEDILPEIKNKIDVVARELIKQLILRISERGFDMAINQVVFVGGGATVVKKYIDMKENYKFIEDIGINAKGYEYILGSTYKRNGEDDGKN